VTGGQSGPGGHSGPPEEPPASTQSTGSTPSTLSTQPARYAETAANAALVLIAIARALLDRQMKAQAHAFETEGGFTERLYRTRTRDGGRTK
jgi:four helix bundle suffix protein